MGLCKYLEDHGTELSMAIGTLTGVISSYKYSYLKNITLVTKSHDPVSRAISIPSLRL